MHTYAIFYNAKDAVVFIKKLDARLSPFKHHLIAKNTANEICEKLGLAAATYVLYRRGERVGSFTV